MAEAVESPRNTALSRLDELVGRLREGAKTWVKLPVEDKAAIARRMLEGFSKVSERSVRAAVAAKGIAPGTPQEGEEWLSGPYVTLRILRLTAEALDDIAAGRNTRIGKLDRTIDGKLRVQVYPMTRLDKLLFGGLTAETVLEAGATEEDLEGRARFYKMGRGFGALRARVALVLGAGNVNSIPPTDVVTKMFTEGKVCILKMNPVNAYMGPFIEEAFKELIEKGWLAVVYGGGEEGSYLCQHAGVDEIHITGSDKTHDSIVWGPPGKDRAERMARNQPLLAKEISSELGNVSPVLVVPGPYTAKELAFQADNIGGQVTNNASFNCNAAKMLVTPKGWNRTAELFSRLEKAISAAPVRKAWYPGAMDRYRQLTAGHSNVTAIGAAGADSLPWTIIKGLDAGDQSEKNFTTEPFCSILSATEIGSDDPIAFLEKAVDFANDRLWGTLSACVVVHPQTLKDPKVNAAFERAIARLRYGAIGINVWPAIAFVLGGTPWGAHPGSTLTNIQSGRGFVHNTSMLERVEKCICRYPVTGFPKLPYFPTHKNAHVLGKKLAAFEPSQSWLQLPGIVGAALKG
jgi:aldehyde dehydrogenase family protein